MDHLSDPLPNLHHLLLLHASRCDGRCSNPDPTRVERSPFIEGDHVFIARNIGLVKGRFGFDYVHHRQRLTKPLIRKEGVGKRKDDWVDPADPSSHFREASWEEALERATSGLKRIRDEKGGGALAGVVGRGALF